MVSEDVDEAFGFATTSVGSIICRPPQSHTPRADTAALVGYSVHFSENDLELKRTVFRVNASRRLDESLAAITSTRSSCGSIAIHAERIHSVRVGFLAFWVAKAIFLVSDIWNTLIDGHPQIWMRNHSVELGLSRTASYATALNDGVPV